jgi:tetratricopeptide (TPR) repeat protein
MRLLCIVLLSPALALAQLPAGTHSVDDTSQSDSIQKQTADAENALEHRDYKVAEAALKALVNSSSKAGSDARILYDLGFAQERLGEDVDAAASYAKSTAANGGFAEPRLALGLLDARLGRADAAQRELQGVVDLAAATPEAKGRALRALARLDEISDPAAASAELLQAIKLTPETQDDLLLSAELAEHVGDWANAEAVYKRLLEAKPSDPEATAGLIHALQQQKKNAAAEALLTAALQQHPADPRLVVQAVSIYAAEGKTAQALGMLDTLQKQDPAAAANPSLNRMRARLLALNGDNAKAEAQYEALAQANPNDASLLDDLGSLQVKLQQYAQAEATLNKAVAMRQGFEDDPAWAEAAAHLAFAASKNNDPQTVLRALAQRATVLANSPSSLFLEATAHDTLRQTKEAELAYRAFLAVADGKFPDQEFQARHRLVALEHTR